MATANIIAIIAFGVLLILGGVLLKPIWSVAVRPFYRNPEAQEPSKLGWGVRSGIMIVAGIIVVVGGIGFLGQADDAEPMPSEAASDRCEAFVDQIERPVSSAATDEAVTSAADEAGYEVERKERSEDSIADLPGGEVTITVTTTTWTVRDGGDTVATFTWTETDNVQGRFGAGDCP